MGRGVRARGRLAATEERMRHIYDLTAPPSTGQPLAGCQAGSGRRLPPQPLGPPVSSRLPFRRPFQERIKRRPVLGGLIGDSADHASAEVSPTPGQPRSAGRQYSAGL